MPSRYEEHMTRIVDQIVDQISTGLADGDWRKPWTSMFASDLQHNAESGRPYHGINQFSLGMTAMLRGLDDPRWGTYRTWQRLEAQVRKGEHGEWIIYWGTAWRCVEHDRPKERCCNAALARPYPKTFTVFNAAQVDGAPEMLRPDGITAEQLSEEVMNLFLVHDVEIATDPSRAFFRHSEPDRVYLPPVEQFESPEGFHATALHELTHWTGHERRLDREAKNPFGTARYAMEELVAELGSAWLQQHLHVKPEPSRNAANYLKGWLGALQDDPKHLYRAAKLATAAVGFLVPETAPAANEEAA